MGNKFLTSTHVDERPVGALVGAGFGLLVMAAGLLLADGSARTTTLLLGLAVLVVAMPLGWLFARRAMRPGIRSAFAAAAGITALAVPIGAIAIGTLMAVGARELTVGELAVAALGLAFVGLLFFGLPLAGLTFVVASVWVGVLRLIVGRWRGGFRSDDEHEPTGLIAHGCLVTAIRLRDGIRKSRPPSLTSSGDAIAR